MRVDQISLQFVFGVWETVQLDRIKANKRWKDTVNLASVGVKMKTSNWKQWNKTNQTIRQQHYDKNSKMVVFKESFIPLTWLITIFWEIRIDNSSLTIFYVNLFKMKISGLVRDTLSHFKNYSQIGDIFRSTDKLCG